MALYFSVLALVLSLLILPRVDSMANLLSPPALTGVVVALVSLAWLAVAVTQSLDHLASHHRLGEDVLVLTGSGEPNFTDYLYPAIGVSASFAPPDVKVQSSTIRRRVTLHTLVAFVFNTVILASVVSALSNALGGA